MPSWQKEMMECRKRVEAAMQQEKEAVRLAWEMNDKAMGYDPEPIKPAKPKGRKKNVY